MKPEDQRQKSHMRGKVQDVLEKRHGGMEDDLLFTRVVRMEFMPRNMQIEVVATSRVCHLHYAKSHFADRNARATVGGTGFAIAASKGHIFRVDGRLEDPSRIFVYTVVDRD